MLSQPVRNPQNMVRPRVTANERIRRGLPLRILSVYLCIAMSAISRLRNLLCDRSVRTGDFTLASGRRSRYYIDARLTTMTGEGQILVGEVGFGAIREAGWTPEFVGGMTLGADPVAYAIAHHATRTGTALDAFTVRKEAKGHGTGRQIEGGLAAWRARGRRRGLGHDRRKPAQGARGGGVARRRSSSGCSPSSIVRRAVPSVWRPRATTFVRSSPQGNCSSCSAIEPRTDPRPRGSSVDQPQRHDQTQVVQVVGCGRHGGRALRTLECESDVAGRHVPQDFEQVVRVEADLQARRPRSLSSSSSWASPRSGVITSKCTRSDSNDIFTRCVWSLATNGHRDATAPPEPSCRPTATLSLSFGITCS